MYVDLIDEMEDILLNCTDCTEEALALIEGVNGTNEETLCDTLYYYTGMNSFREFLLELEGWDEYDYNDFEE